MSRTIVRGGLVLVCLMAVAVAEAQAAGDGDAGPEVRTGGDAVLTIKGFVSTTLYLQDRSFSFGNGQWAQWPATAPVDADPWFADGDVRNTRLTLAMSGVAALGGQVGGAVELDFFGGFNGDSPFSDEQPMPRLRLAYAELSWDRLMLRVGQYWSPLFGYVPDSISHIAFPLGYGSGGFVGWRFPGLFLYYTLADAPTKVQLQVAAMRGSWTGVEDGDILGGRSQGNAALVPQLEARLDLSGSGDGVAWGAFLAAHYDRKDTSGVGVAEEGDALDGWAAELGARMQVSIFSLKGNLYTGRAIGQQFGHITQFGDIAGWGGWIQGGVDVTDRVGVFAFYGRSDPDDDDVLATDNTRLRNQQFAAMVRYDAGAFAVGAEWLHAWLLHDEARETAVGNQLSVSGLYRF